MKRIFFILLSAVLVSMAGSASALIQTYDINYSNDSGLGPTYANVDISQNAPGADIVFDILAGNDQELRNFYLNTAVSGFDVDTIVITATDPTPLDKPYKINFYPTGTQMDGFGLFMIEFAKQGEHDVIGLSFKITNLGPSTTINDFVILSTGSAGNGFGHFAAEVLDVAGGQGYTFKARDSFTPQVPEPGMLALFGSGLLGIAFFRFRK